MARAEPEGVTQRGRQPKEAAPGSSASRSVVVSPNGPSRTRRRHESWSPTSRGSAGQLHITYGELNPKGSARQLRFTDRDRQLGRPEPNQKASRIVVVSPNGSCRTRRRVLTKTDRWNALCVHRASARPPNSRLQLTPLARPSTWLCFHSRLVPPLASLNESCQRRN
jgi:hypothetical protein